jgi:hypothetical protein
VTQRGGPLTVLADVVQTIVGRGSHWQQVATMSFRTTAAPLDIAAVPGLQVGS